MKGFFASITRNPVSLVGVAITTVAAVLFLSLFAVEMSGFHGNPYLGIISYIVVPTIFAIAIRKRSTSTATCWPERSPAGSKRKWA